MLFFYPRFKPVCDAVLHDAQRIGGMFLLPISKHCPVKLHECLLNAEKLKPALSRQ
jgi:hypothetical protein